MTKIIDGLRWFTRVAGAALGVVLWVLPAAAQLPPSSGGSAFVVTTCGTLPSPYTAGQTRAFTIDQNGNECVTGTFVLTPSGTQNVNLIQILGAPPSLTNPLWVFPATGAIFPIAIDQTTPGTTNGVVVNSSALPTGAATAANQATIIINTTGLATAAAQTTGNSSLATIATNTTNAATIANQTAVQGPVPAGAATATRFNLGGCEYRVTLPTLADTNQGPCQVDTRGGIFTVLKAGNSTNPIGSTQGNSDAVSATNIALVSVPYNLLYNGTTWDRLRSIQGWAATGLGVLAAIPAPTSSANGANAYVSTSALAANQIVKGSAGNLYSFQVSADSTLSGAAWWVMIYDATTAPGDGAVTPAKCYAVPSGTTSYSAAFQMPIRLATGITIGVSTTGCFTKTASTHAFISGDAQ